MSVCVSVCLSVSLSVCPSVCLSVSLSLALSVRLYVCLSVCACVCLLELLGFTVGKDDVGQRMSDLEEYPITIHANGNKVLAWTPIKLILNLTKLKSWQ